MIVTTPNRESQLEAAMAEYLGLLESGQRPDRTTFLAARAELEAELEPILARIEKLHGV